MQYLAEGLHLPRRVKQYEKVLTRIGRLRQRYSRVARYYDIRLEKDAASGNAKALVWTRIIPTEDTLPGVYCLRTNQADWDESTLWNTYTMLTDLDIDQPCCLRKEVIRTWKGMLAHRYAGGWPSRAVLCGARAGVRTPARQPTPASGCARPGGPGVRAPSPCRSN